MSGHTLTVKINEDIRKDLGVANIKEKMKEHCLICFGRVQRQVISQPVKSIESWSLSDLNRGQGRPKMTWNTGLENDVKELDLQFEMVENRNE